MSEKNYNQGIMAAKKALSDYSSAFEKELKSTEPDLQLIGLAVLKCVADLQIILDRRLEL